MTETPFSSLTERGAMRGVAAALAVNAPLPGRGAWTHRGMPPNATIYYELVSGVLVGTPFVPTDLDHVAVNFGVRQIQHRINDLLAKETEPRGVLPQLFLDGVFATATRNAVVWAQTKMKVTVDGIVGPKTMRALMWPVIRAKAGVPLVVRHAVGGIAEHESRWDPGAVGALLPDDIGMVQINGPANPTWSIARRFNFVYAFDYAARRVADAYASYGDIHPAVASYAAPLWGDQWAAQGHAPNDAAQAFVDFVLAWVPPF